MKARMVCEREITHPDLKTLDDVAALRNAWAEKKISREVYLKRSRILAKPGHVIDHPMAWRLVTLGLAEPFDAECRQMISDHMLKKMESGALILAAEAMDVAQSTGNPRFDATDDQVAKYKADRAKRHALMDAVE